MTARFHEGELAVQARAGVQEQAGRVGRGIQAAIPSAVSDFLAERRWALVGATDGAGRLWASLVSGAPGFLQALDDNTLHIGAELAAADPLAGTMSAGAAVGLLAIDLADRRRVRLNGTVVSSPGGGITIRAEEVFGNCQKYIQARAVDELPAGGSTGGAADHGSALTADQQTWLGQADTFFVASAHPAGGADLSHRGGAPGFIEVRNAHTLAWPDYAGNMMFQTLGNIAVNPRVGILVPDFATGRVLQLTGRARIIWDPDAVTHIPGAERLVEFELDEVVETGGQNGLRGRLLSRSPFNPVADGPVSQDGSDA